MKYTVVWLPQALNRLADIWNRASDQQAVADASNWIERALRRDAHRKGLVHGDQRVYIRQPLAVTFEVSPDDCMVTVVRVERT